MKLFANAIYLSCNQRTGKDGKIYTNVNIDCEGEIFTLPVSDAGPFLQLERYKPYTFVLNYGTYRNQAGGQSSYLRVEDVRSGSAAK